MNRKTRLLLVKWVRPVSVILLVAAFAIAYFVFEGFESEVDRAVSLLTRGDIQALRDYILSFGVWAPLISVALMILQALLAFLPAFVIAFANGLAFGFFWGGLLSLVSAVLAAAICFEIAHFVGRRPVETLVGKRNLGAADKWFARYGAYAVLVFRLIPVVSFDAISYAAGLTRMGILRFMAATTVGMAPATFVYSYIGGRAPQYIDLFLVAFGVVVSVGIIAALVRHYRHNKDLS